MANLTPKLIRDDAIARLVAAATVAGARVYDSKTTKDQDDDDLPRLSVYTPKTTRVNVSRGIGIPRFRVTLDLVIEGVLEPDVGLTGDAADADLADKLDAFEIQIANALLTDADWVCQFESVGNMLTDKGRDADSNQRRGSVQCTFELQYTEVFEPVTVTDDLKTVQLDVNLDADADIEASATYEDLDV